jgi:hypothetical protein
MGKSSSKAVQGQAVTLLAEWDKLRQQVGAIEARRERATHKHREQFEAAVAPINERFDAQVTPLRSRKAEVEAELERLLKSTIKDGVAAVPQVETAEAIAELQSRPTREISAKDFFDATPASERTASFWGCFKVLLTHADKFNSALVNRLAKVKFSHSVTVRAK